MKILITGITGALGSYITQEWKKEHEILGVYHHRVPVDKDIPYVSCKDEHFDDIVKGFAPDVIVHTACVYETDDLDMMIDANYTFPAHLLTLCHRLSKVRFINCNTSLHKNVNFYALLKKQFSEFAQLYCDKQEGLTFINVEMEMFYGAPRDSHTFLARMIKQLSDDVPYVDVTEGLQKRDLICISDVKDALFLLMHIPLSVSYIDIPCGSGIAVSIKEVLLFMKEKIGSVTELRFGKVPMRKHEADTYVADLTLLHTYGWEPKVMWQDGLENMIYMHLNEQEK